jgi:AraC-like DNA-binding protein
MAVLGLFTSRIARNIKKTARTLVYDPNVPSDRALLEVLRSIRPIEGAALDTIAARAGWSPFHLHRAFRAMVGETPKQYTLRLRLEHAVARLITSGDAVLDIALAMGFNSHEVFTRAFRRRFGCTPAAYRASFRRVPEPIRRAHAAVIETAGACIGVYHIAVNSSSRRAQMPTLSIERRDLSPQPFLFVHAKAGRTRSPRLSPKRWGRRFRTRCRPGWPLLAGRPRAISAPALAFLTCRSACRWLRHHQVTVMCRAASFPVAPLPSASTPAPTIRSARRTSPWNDGWNRTDTVQAAHHGNRTLQIQANSRM